MLKLNGESERLTIVGWASLLAFCGGIGGAVGFGAGKLLAKKED